ncbi:MAG TPA: Nramp family divalent metal transporter [Actinomycetota bacterium]|nr:Nramp family divalent metal transporter [Actinomycetota bacterium]
MRKPRIHIPRPRIPVFAYLAVMGPGIITAAANNDAGGITAYSVAGAHYGFDMLWILFLLTILLAITQEMGARMGAVTGKGLADLIREQFGLRASVFALAILMFANLAVTSAEFAGVAAGFELFGAAKWISVPLMALGVWGLVSSGSFRRVERIFLVFVLFYVAYVVSGIMADPPWEQVFKRLVVPDTSPAPGFLLLAIAITGTTVAPWGQFFIQSYVKDKGVKIEQYPMTRADVFTGALFTNTIAFFIIVATAATLFPLGLRIETAEDAARALAPLAGEAAKSLFGVGFIAASVLSAAILPLSTAYVVCEAFGWESGVGKNWEEAPVFNAIFTAMIVVGAAVPLIPGINLVTLMLVAQTLNGVLLPVILIYTVKLAANKRLMGKHANGPIYNTLTWGFAAAIVALTVYLLVQPLL